MCFVKCYRPSTKLYKLHIECPLILIKTDPVWICRWAVHLQMEWHTLYRAVALESTPQSWESISMVLSSIQFAEISVDEMLLNSPDALSLNLNIYYARHKFRAANSMTLLFCLYFSKNLFVAWATERRFFRKPRKMSRVLASFCTKSWIV